MLVCRSCVAALRSGSLFSRRPVPADVHVMAMQSTCEKSCPKRVSKNTVASGGAGIAQLLDLTELCQASPVQEHGVRLPSSQVELL